MSGSGMCVFGCAFLGIYTDGIYLGGCLDGPDRFGYSTRFFMSCGPRGLEAKLVGLEPLRVYHFWVAD